MCASYPNDRAEVWRISVSATVAGHLEKRTEAAGLIESQGMIGSSQESGEWLCTMIRPHPYRGNGRDAAMRRHKPLRHRTGKDCIADSYSAVTSRCQISMGTGRAQDARL
jgi:hypothetical protein